MSPHAIEWRDGRGRTRWQPATVGVEITQVRCWVFAMGYGAVCWSPVDADSFQPSLFWWRWAAVTVARFRCWKIRRAVLSVFWKVRP